MADRGRRRTTLRRKIITTLCMVLVSMTMVEFGVFMIVFEHGRDEAEQARMAHIASRLAERLSPSLSPETDYGALRLAALDALESWPSTAIFIVSADGRIEGELNVNEDRVRETVDVQPIRTFLGTWKEGQFPIYGDDPNSTNGRTIFSAAPIAYQGRDAYLYVMLRRKATENAFKVLLENSTFIYGVLAIGAVVALSALLGALAFGHVMRRFSRITATVGLYHSGISDVRLPVEDDDEIDDLARAINGMADRIAASIEELRRRDALRRELVANVAHDLRGPLAHIRGHAELLRAKDAGSAPANLEELSAVITASTSSLQRLLDELFELAKLEAAEKVPQRINFPVDELAYDLANAYRFAAMEKGITLSYSGPESLPEVSADLSMIERVLRNLIDNALRYTPAGGTIAVECALAGDAVAISVADTGIGVPPEDLPYIFERFNRAGNNPLRDSVSTGLGLAIVDRIIALHGSSVDVDSAPGKGTRFTFTLPISSREARWNGDACRAPS